MKYLKGATSRPTGFVELNNSSPLAGGCTYLSNVEGHYPYDVVRKQLGVPGGTVATSISALGPCLDTVAASVSNNVSISNSVDKLVPLDKVTVVTIRQKKDSTARSAANWGASSSFRGAAPSTAGTLFWEFGTPNASVSGLTWDTRIDYLIYIAGPTKGREVWRNGERIVKTADTAARASDTTTFFLGNDGNFASDLEYVYYFGVFDNEWSNEYCLEWFNNPWQLFKGQSLKLFTQSPVHTSSGSLVGQGTVLSGNAQHIISHSINGSLSGQGSIITGNSQRERSHLSSGIIAGQGSIIVGSSTITKSHQVNGILIGQISLLSGVSTKTGSSDNEYILVEMTNSNILAEMKDQTIIIESNV